MYTLIAVALLAAVVDLVATALGWHEVRLATKPLPALLLAIAAARARRVPRPLVTGLLFAALGDEVLLQSGSLFFMLGMGAFALMHVCYIAAFRSLGSGKGRVVPMPWHVLPYVAAQSSLDVMLWPLAGNIAVPIVVYSVLLAAMAACALDAAGRTGARSGMLIAGGAAVFMISDTLLAFSQFWPAFPLSPSTSELAVMSTYFIAQLAIGCAVIDVGRSDRSPRRRH
jgi:uncharacterized membrane protein YhhN